jgi:general secretion pathway protein B
MSLILDALRRADAQRERQSPPGLHAPAVAVPGDDAQPAPAGWRLFAWIGDGLLLAVVLAWVLGGRPGAAGPSPGPVAALPAPAGSARDLPQAAASKIEPPPRPAMIRASAPAATASSRRPPQEATTPEATATPEPAADPAQETLSRDQRLQPQPAPPAPAPAPAPAAMPGPAPAGPFGARPQAPPAAAAPGAVAPRASALPAGAPQVSVSGGVYSRNRAQRMVIVNGQVHGEGAQPVEGVTIEQIEADRAVLTWKGERFTVRY